MAAAVHPLELTNVRRRLHEHLPELRRLKVDAVYLFGSVARNEARSDSDVDILVEVRHPFSYFDLIDVQRFLEDVLGCAVDVGTFEMLKPGLRRRVEREAVRAA